MTPFYKLHGAGNDFLFFVDVTPQPEQAATLCNRHTGIGADGIVWLKQLGGNRYRWDFYNSDGSAAEMCGNAARCAVRLVQHLFQDTEMELETGAGTIFGKIEGDGVSVSFDIASTPIKEIAQPAGSSFPKGYFLTTGVPHCVIPEENPHAMNARKAELAPYIHNTVFGTAGSNLTFANLKKQPIPTVSLERGVEDFTLACGTGVIATAKVYQYLNKTSEPVTLVSPGGRFTVSFDGLRATLVGPAEFIFKGEL